MHQSDNKAPVAPQQDDDHHAIMNHTLRLEAKWWVLFAIGASTFMSALDGSVVNTTLPIITKSLNSHIAATEWIVTIYLLVLSGLLLSFGRLGDLRGHKPVFILGFSIFILSSMICGLATSVWMLVIARGIQAIGAAMLSANSPAILTKSFPARQRGQALGLQATMTYLGLTVGPSLGGWLTEHFGWRSVFFINVPVGLIAVFISWRAIASDGSREKSDRFDIPGAITFMAGLVALLFTLNQGHALGWLSWPILLSMVMSFLLLTAFIFIEKSSSYPMLDLSLFNHRIFRSTVICAVLNYICVYGILFLTPFYLIQARGLSPAHAGLILTSMPIVMAIVAPLSGTLSDRIGTYIPSLVGMVILAGGLLAMSTINEYTSLIRVSLSLGFAGLGIGIFISPNNSALMGSAPRSRQGIAAGILATSRNGGMALGVGLAGAILTTYIGHRPDVDPNSLISALHASFLVTTGIALLGTIILRPH